MARSSSLSRVGCARVSRVFSRPSVSRVRSHCKVLLAGRNTQNNETQECQIFREKQGSEEEEEEEEEGMTHTRAHTHTHTMKTKNGHARFLLLFLGG